MTTVEPTTQPVAATASAPPEPYRMRPRTQYWDMADCCWHDSGRAADIPAPRDGD